jgi:translation elongation factor EF-Tu-like GTPase
LSAFPPSVPAARLSPHTAMSDLLLQSVEDVFQIEGRGTVVTGRIGLGWEAANPGDEIVLLTPGGQTMRTAIKDKEIFRKGGLRATTDPVGGSAAQGRVVFRCATGRNTDIESSASICHLARHRLSCWDKAT